MALTKHHREELRKIKQQQSRKFFRTGVSVKGSLKGTDNTPKEVGVKRETTIKHKTIGGAIIEMNANVKSKIVPKLGKAEPKIEKDKDINSIGIRLEVIKQGSVTDVIEVSAEIVTTVPAAHDELVDRITGKLCAYHGTALVAFADAADNRGYTFVPVSMDRGVYSYKFEYMVK
ncbi:MAG: hypothetical protein ACRDCE_19915 [Cetobacterium sp.]|uniref:hypothetical protein n=1 Tax=Cetobacterium sp. TaxID=2071632 RepID=UPI003EE5D17E